MKKLMYVLSFLVIGLVIHYGLVHESENTEELFLILILIIVIFLYREGLLHKNNEKLKILQDELIELNYNLEAKFISVNHDLEKAQEVAKIGSWVLDNQKKDLRWSVQTYIMFEISQDVKHENLYSEFMNRVHPDDLDNLRSTFNESLQNKENYKFEHRLLMDDGSIKYIFENCETSYDDNGKPLVSYGTVQDITEATIHKMKLKEKNLQLLHKSRLAQMGEMLSMIAHQWKQPLGSISAAQISVLMAIEMQQYDLNDKDQREEFLKFTQDKLHKISRYVQNLSQIIADFSDFYKPNQKSEIIKIDDVIKKSNSLFGDILSQSAIDLEINLDSDDKVYIHENEFIQVVLNIVMNAKEQLVDKCIVDAKITIETYSIADDVFVEISDNAGGIEEDIISKLFDPYFSTKLEKNGTGLGLYMSKTIIKDYHHGDIYAKNSENGAIFTIRIKKYKREVHE